MDQLQNDLRHCCNFLDSNKVTERKKSSSDLQNLLQRSDVVTLLNGNSERKDGLTWDNLLLTSHRGLLKEADKIRDDEHKSGKQSSRLDNSKTVFCGLITTISRRANTGDVQRLTVTSLMQCVLNILQENFLRKHFGATYLQILRFQLLSCYNYCVNIGGQTWKDLFELIEHMYNEPPPGVDRISLLATLSLIIGNGGLLSPLALEVKKRLPFITRCVKGDARQPSVQEYVVRLALTTCQLLEYESRMAICKFGEDVMSDLRNMYNYRADGLCKKKDLLLDWFLLQARAHHPGGAQKGTTGAYAGQWEVWTRQLGWLYQLIIAEITAVLRNRNITTLRPNFITLAVCVCKQIFETNTRELLDMSLIPNLNDTSLIETAGSAPKRIKLETGIPAILDRLTTISQQDMWPWLSLLSALASTYPELVSESNLVSVLQFCAEQLQTCQNTTTTEGLYRCCVSLFNTERMKDSRLLDTTKLKELWDTVWETSLRAIGLNICEEWSHQLVQKLVRSDKMFPVDSLLALFVSGAIHRSKHSLTTLLQLSTKYCLCEHLLVSQCKVLLEWVLPNIEETLVEDCRHILSFTNLIAKTVVVLTLKAKIPPEPEMIESKITPIEEHYLTTSFENGVFTNENGIVRSSKNSRKITIIADSQLMEYLMSLLTRNQFLAKQSSSGPDALSQDKASIALCFHSCLIINIINVMAHWSLTFETRLETYLLESCDIMASLTQKILMNQSDIPTISAVLKRIVNLFRLLSTVDKPLSLSAVKKLGTTYLITACNQLASVSQRAHQPTNEFDFEITEIRPSYISEETSLLDDKSIYGWSEVQLAAYTAVVEYSRWHPDLMERMLALPVANNKDISPTCTLHMALLAAKVVCALPALEDYVLEELLVMMQNICRKWHASDVAIIAILDIFQEMSEHVKMVEDCQDNYNVLITGILKFIKRDKYGAHVSTRFVQLLGHLAQIDPVGSWCTWVSDDGSVKPLVYQVFTFITSPFHQVRIAACQMMWRLFSTPAAKQQKDVFAGLISAVNDIFIVQGELQMEEEIDEGILRTATTLHCFAAVISITSKWRSEALFNLFTTTVEKNLNTDLVNKVLKVICKSLYIENVKDLMSPALPILFWNWHEKFNTFQNFPWTLVGQSTEASFYSAHTKDIVTVLIYRRDSGSLNHIATVVGQSVPLLVEVSYPSLIGSILPKFADENQQNFASVIISTLEQHLGEEKVKVLLISKLGDVLTSMVERLHDEQHLRALCNNESFDLPLPTKLSFPSQFLIGGMQYIQDNSPKSETPLLLFISQEKPRLIQKVLLKLYVKVFEAKLPEYKLLYLQQWVSLCERLMEVLVMAQYRLAHYTVRWITQALLLQTIRHTHTHTALLLAVSYLRHFLATVLSVHASVIDDMLPRIVTALVPLASQTTSIGKTVVQVLELLFINHIDSLPSAAALDPLPADPMFTTMTKSYQKVRYKGYLSTSLEAEIQHALNASSYGLSNRAEGLRHLRKQLALKKSELAQLYKELQDTRGFSEDCEKSQLHQLICMLVGYTASPDPKVQHEAVCCLGELGPADLTTLGLKPQLTSSTSQPLESFLETTIKYLQTYLFDSDVAVMLAASDALYALFTNFHSQLNVLLSKKQIELFHPFINPAKKQKESVIVNEEALNSVIEMFCPDEDCSHRDWITRLVSAILHACHIGYLVPVCSFKVEFCDDLFPLVVDLVLHVLNKRTSTENVIMQINDFFNRHMINNHLGVYGHRDSLMSMLRVVHVARKHLKEKRKINYLYVAKGALFCSAYFTSVMYAELWANEYNSDREDLDMEGMSQLEFIEEKDTENGQLLQNLLREAYMKVGEPDAVYGCGNTHLSDRQTLSEHYQYEGRWRDVVEACDTALFVQPSSSFNQTGFENALHYCGLYHLAGRLSEKQSYDACWRLGQWERPEPVVYSHESLVYTALRAATHRDTPQALRALDHARALVVNTLAHTALEAATTIYTPLARLQALQEIEDFVSHDFLIVAKKWDQQDRIGWVTFTQIEPIFAQRMTMLKHNKILEQDRCAKVFLNAIEAARLEGFYAMAHSWLASITSLYQLPPDLSSAVQLLNAQLYWDKQETYTARHILRQLLAHLKGSSVPSLYAKALQTYGLWVAQTRTEQSQQIMDKYLIPAVEISDDTFKLTSAYSLARYADAEYQSLLNYIKSSAYTNKMKSISESLVNAEKLSVAAEVTKKLADVDKQTRIDLQKSINLHDKQSKIDQTEVENAQKELDSFLILSIRHYLLGLEIGDLDNLSIFRVVSLWLSNYRHAVVAEELGGHISQVPTYKVLPVLPQLAARISHSPTSPDTATAQSTALLHSLIERCAQDHPHHVLPLVMALANSNKDLEYSQSSLHQDIKPEPRVTGAQKMLNKLKQKEPLKTLIKDMQIVADAYISLANCTHEPEKSAKAYKIPKSEPITKLKLLSHVLCPTVNLSVKKNANYPDIIGIQGFAETYYSVGGINVPKKITCICTDGRKRPQLVKGNDDLRQDAVMQQVFTIMNSLLCQNKETLKRRLLIRTYKVVPMSQRSGVIEWCSNTLPLSTYLIGSREVAGAHSRFRKDDWSPSYCRQKLMETAKFKNNKKLAVFKEICANFKPVFHHFFYEKFPNPGIWFERKLAYTHSVATSSMVGYILGLGDRHILNILIDEHTAEVVHIDFGIAFEQGRTLMTPETVPFRLTRDIVDGMGVLGIEGIFRRSCEKTMEVLREYQSTILTILEVLLYDPLYMWTMTPAKSIAKQSDKPLQFELSQAPAEGQVNKLAERALIRLKQKLQGIEEGSTTSIEGQVSKLIQEATNPVNLSRLFNGWQAHV